jgi:uncharacterized protein YndB with AHSA1/START domain
MTTTKEIPAEETANREIVTTRLFDAPRELGFRAWEEPKLLVRWWDPKASIVEPERISFTDKLDEDGQPSREAFMLAIATFEDHEGKTKLTARALHYTDANRDKHEQMGFHKGWGEMLERLEAHVTKP